MMANDRPAGFVPIPQELDTQAKFFIWDMDVVAIFLTVLSLGLFVGSFWLGTAAGLLLARLWARMAQGQAKGFGIHTLYWHLPGNVFKRLPASWHRDLLG